MKDNKISQAGEPASAPLQYQTSPLHRILLVDDESSQRQLSTATLIHSGYEVDAATDGAAGWEALQAKHYDLLITDNSMPKVTGFEMVKLLRSQDATLPVIMASRAVSTGELKRHPGLEINAILVKPYTNEELVRAVKKVLREAEITGEDSPLSMYHDLKAHKISQAGERAGAPRRGPANYPHSILVVDENNDLRRLYADALTGSGDLVDVAEDGADGWEALQANSYDLLITENHLPNLTGVELVKKLRAARMSLPVIVAITGTLPKEDLNRYPWFQPAATLREPYTLAELVGTVKKILRAIDDAHEPIDPLPDWPGQPSAVGLRL